MPGNRCAPVMADHARLGVPEQIHGCLDIATQGNQVISRGLTRRAALPIATHFRDRHPITGRRKGADLLTPGVPAFGKTVQQPQRAAIGRPRAVETERDAVDVEQLVVQRIHNASMSGLHYDKGAPSSAPFINPPNAALHAQPWAVLQSIRYSCQVARISKPKPMRYQAKTA